MMCQGAGGGYGDVLQRDPKLVIQDIEENLMSPELAVDIYKVAFDPKTLIVDEAETARLRAAERQARMTRGLPYDEFVKTWTTPEPPAALPFMGCWDNPAIIYGMMAGQRVRMNADNLQSQFMLNPKDVLIAELQAQLAKTL
jgi:hypothetical protein